MVELQELFESGVGLFAAREVVRCVLERVAVFVEGVVGEVAE